MWKVLLSDLLLNTVQQPWSPLASQQQTMSAKTWCKGELTSAIFEKATLKNRNSTDIRQACCISSPMLHQGFVTNTPSSVISNSTCFSLFPVYVLGGWLCLGYWPTWLGFSCSRFKVCSLVSVGFPRSSDCEESDWNAGDLGSTPGSGNSPGEGNGYPLQYSCLENPMDRSLVDYSPWGCKESDMAKRLTLPTLAPSLHFLCTST